MESSEYFKGRIAIIDNRHGFGKASINLTSIRENDSGWYECRIMFPNRSPNKRSNGTWFHLAVDGEIKLNSLKKLKGLFNIISNSYFIYW